MPPPHPLEPLAGLAGVPDAVEAARAACDALRWHRAMRRRWAEVRAEAGLRAVAAGLRADGVPVPLAEVRDVARGAAGAPPGPVGDALRGALRVQAQVEQLAPPPGRAAPSVAAGQLLARLHAAAVGPAADAGRPRDVAPPGDLRGLGEAPSGAVLAARLAALGDLLARPVPPSLPGLVVAAVAYGEVLLLRPFAQANGVVARGLWRHLLVRLGTDPTGAVVPEVAWADTPAVHVSAAAHLGAGGPEGVARWLVHCAEGVVAGAAEATRVADGVLAGRLPG